MAVIADGLAMRITVVDVSIEIQELVMQRHCVVSDLMQHVCDARYEAKSTPPRGISCSLGTDIDIVSGRTAHCCASIVHAVPSLLPRSSSLVMSGHHCLSVRTG